MCVCVYSQFNHVFHLFKSGRLHVCVWLCVGWWVGVGVSVYDGDAVYYNKLVYHTQRVHNIRMEITKSINSALLSIDTLTQPISSSPLHPQEQIGIEGKVLREK